MYRDSPSWDESYLQKNPGGQPALGGRWAGGRAYITCSRRAVDLAKRPQNLAAVKKLTSADSYFIDTTYAAGLQECYDPRHPLTRADDLKWKQAISDYAREVFGSFGSECGREWAIPHADFFEGLTGVSGTYYHDKNLLARLGAVPVPLFEMVYRDCIAMYGKYGYDIHRSAEYVLHHVHIGRPLNYHSVPSHLYWKEKAGAGAGAPLALAPSVSEFQPSGPRTFRIAFRTHDSAPAALQRCSTRRRGPIASSVISPSIHSPSIYQSSSTLARWGVSLRILWCSSVRLNVRYITSMPHRKRYRMATSASLSNAVPRTLVSR
jgi:hypothetical protein